MVKNSQSSQNSNFAMSLQYLKKELKAEVDFFHAEFPKRLFQHFEQASKLPTRLILSILMGMIKCFQLLKQVCNIFAVSQKRN